VLSQPLNGASLPYHDHDHDHDGIAVDAIVQLRDDRWVAIER
jgi:hypothetical protein